MKNRSIRIIAHDVRSAHNVGSLFRTGDGFAVEHIYLTGYTPYPKAKGDRRLPHIADKIDRMIAKTALGAEKQVAWSHRDSVSELLLELKRLGFTIVFLEQHDQAVSIDKFRPTNKIVLLLGSELDGINPDLFRYAECFIEIPMFGQKESFNVSVAAGIALYALRTG